MRGRSLIFVAIILPAGALAQDSAPDARIAMITHEQTDPRAGNRFTGYEGHGGTPEPSGKAVDSGAAIIPYQKTPFNSICGAEALLLSSSVQGDPQQAWEWVGDGTLIKSDVQIGRPDGWEWVNNSHAQAIADKVENGAVHFGLMGSYEGNANSPCAIGKWGTSDAPTWPSIWVERGIPEPSTYGILIVLLFNGSGKPVGENHPVRDTWGHIKEELQ